VLERAIEECRAAGILGAQCLGSDLAHDVIVTRGAGAYICGEETGLLESLEGKKASRARSRRSRRSSRLRHATTVNNVETFSHAPHIVKNGAAWFAASGPKRAPARRCSASRVSSSGRVSTSCRSARGSTRSSSSTPADPLPGRKVKGVIPAACRCRSCRCRSSTADGERVLRERKTLLGTGGVMVLDDTVCMVRVVA